MTPDASDIQPGAYYRTPGVPTIITAPAPPVLQPRESRVGPILFTLGLGLIAVDFLLVAYTYYALTNSPSFDTFRSIQLYMAIAQLFTAIGAPLAGVGWLLDKREIARVQGKTASGEGSSQRLAGQVLVLLGATAIGAATLVFGILEFEVYYNVAVNLPTWSVLSIYAAEGIGVLVIAVGWWIHRTASS